jgi:hypothetical protein
MEQSLLEASSDFFINYSKCFRIFLTSQVIGKSCRKRLLERSGYRCEDSIRMNLGKGWYEGVN